ncbi:DNA internalization-related competence protein ComEC/Rec2 [Photobacterium lucens]|uniref:DNA internalization-related competence protein ComEC/Rec2 n=2 Tax=Photobacterium lucens TaxID=2562949 RepID=UPI00136DAF49|nr:DNA internalization-related competence protein ComEC/Rec2 [Photobacterium lucens]MBP2701747.1 DNA internalization-related competence protein ComEC/Rec2 [Vibrio parahaemolyticus]MZG55052.1 DNA internalization-related competence protein ComEC/Rec2 [Photobacterium lucens]MZG82412.1 DNA internalization-related competence protein ComEC/Rec2 [Photobacterium lucens]
MLQIALGIAIGFHTLLGLSVIPHYGWYMTGIIVSVVIYYYCRNQFLFWFSISAFLAALSAEQYLKKVDDVPLNRTNLTINVRVSAVLNENIPNTYFEAVVIDAYLPSNQADISLSSSHRLLILWPDAPVLKQGQIWQLPVKLSRIVGRINQAGFDAERHAVSRNIHGRAVVRVSGSNIPVLITQHITWRQQLFDRVTQLTNNMPYQAYLLALAFGERSGLDKDDWTKLRDSGTAHLLAISGLHIALAMLLGWMIGAKLKLLLPQKTLFIWTPMITGLTVALVYAWLAGLTIPTIRALLMCFIIGSLKTTGSYWRHWQVLLVTLSLSLLLAPFAIYSASFWLSFYAVAVLVLFSVGQRYFPLVKMPHHTFSTTHLHASFLQLVKIQCWLLVLMLPIQWLWFGGISIAAPIANLFAVPWISFITVPLVLIAVITLWFPMLSSTLWQCANWSLLPVVEGIAWLEGAWYGLSMSYQPVLWCVVIIVLGATLLPFRRFKWLYISLLFLSVIGILKPNNKTSQWQVMVLDVGHGLAVIIHKAGRAILYDTGNRWQESVVAGSTILPVLENMGIKQLDYLVISHDDSDHAGGKALISEKFSPQYSYSSNYNDEGYFPCIKGQSWSWQGLSFTVQWPIQQVSRARNPHSCVVRIQAENGQGPSLLLTGDIDAIAELMLVKLAPTLTADILLVPHHGSKTSSTNTFLDHVKPSLALVSTGVFNSWNLPAQAVKEKYQQRNIQWLSTGRVGQITIDVDNESYQVRTQRSTTATQWYRPKWL